MEEDTCPLYRGFRLVLRCHIAARKIATQVHHSAVDAPKEQMKEVLVLLLQRRE